MVNYLWYLELCYYNLNILFELVSVSELLDLPIYMTFMPLGINFIIFKMRFPLYWSHSSVWLKLRGPLNNIHKYYFRVINALKTPECHVYGLICVCVCLLNLHLESVLILILPTVSSILFDIGVETRVHLESKGW